MQGWSREALLFMQSDMYEVGLSNIETDLEPYDGGNEQGVLGVSLIRVEVLREFALTGNHMHKIDRRTGLCWRRKVRKQGICKLSCGPRAGSMCKRRWQWSWVVGRG
jgi:hypothetical protein